jgi:RHS repeat-associated protein
LTIAGGKLPRFTKACFGSFSHLSKDVRIGYKGNLIKKAEVQGTQKNILEEYSYNILNQLQSYKNNVTGKAGSCNYFVDGLRKSKAVGGTTTNYYNDGSNVIIETDGNNNLVARNIIGLKNIGRQESNGNINYFLYNAHGDITQLVGNTGEILNNYQYDLYGKEKQTTENIKNPIRYAVQYYDEESGLYYLRARYYSPDIMRFISEDSYRGDIRNPGSLNLYGYCEGDPIGHVDFTGNNKITITEENGGGCGSGGGSGGNSGSVKRLFSEIGKELSKVLGDVAGDLFEGAAEASNLPVLHQDHTIINNYQRYYSEAWSQVVNDFNKGNITIPAEMNWKTVLGQRTDAIARNRLINFLRREGIPEGPQTDVLVNRWLRDPSGSGKYRIPDVRLKTTRTILDGTIGNKTVTSPQIQDFIQFSGGDNVIIIKP